MINIFAKLGRLHMDSKFMTFEKYHCSYKFIDKYTKQNNKADKVLQSVNLTGPEMLLSLVHLSYQNSYEPCTFHAKIQATYILHIR